MVKKNIKNNVSLDAPSFLVLLFIGKRRALFKSKKKMEELLNQYETVATENVKIWFKAGNIKDFPSNRGGCIKYKNKQIAIFNFERRNAWYACQNACPHKMEMVLSRGMTGSADGVPKIACPMHKKTFSLIDGSNLNGDDYKIATYPVKIEGDEVFVGFLD